MQQRASNKKPYELILFISPNIPETITRFTQLQEQDMETLLYEEQ